METAKKIFTIGHSNRSIDELLHLLQAFNISVLADVRSFPGSKKWPQFNKHSLSLSLHNSGISYIHMPLLGGKIAAPGGYNAYMQTDTFHNAITVLEEVATLEPTAYMCAEAEWRHCHRQYISNYLKENNWQIMHIRSATLLEEHSYTLKQGKLF